MSSVAEMKPSQVLRWSLARFEGGKNWSNCFGHGGRMCAVQAINREARTLPEFHNALEVMKRANRIDVLSDWNDAQINFSVIEQGFQKAIELAESEGK